MLQERLGLANLASVDATSAFVMSNGARKHEAKPASLHLAKGEPASPSERRQAFLDRLAALKEAMQAVS